MKKSIPITDSIKEPLAKAIVAVRALKDHTVEVYQVLDQTSKTMKSEHYATIEAFRREVDQCAKSINGLLEGAVDNIWDLAISRMPDTPEKQGVVRAEDQIQQQFNKITRLVQ